jgi:hypothetical protein
MLAELTDLGYVVRLAFTGPVRAAAPKPISRVIGIS